MSIVTKSSFKFFTEQIVNIKTLAAATAAASASAITVTGEGITKTIGLKLDGNTLTQSANGLKSTLTLKKLTTAASGFAASYQLQDGTGTQIGDQINLIKDQLLKNVELVTGDGAAHSLSTGASMTSSEVEEAEEGSYTTLTSGSKYLHFVFSVKVDATAGNDVDSHVYLNVNDLFDSYTADNDAGVVVDNSTNKISAKLDTTDTVLTAANTNTPILSKGNSGIKVNGIQTAIDYAVGIEAARATAAEGSINNRISSLEQGGSSRALTTVTSATDDVVTADYQTTSVLYVNISDEAEAFNINPVHFPEGGEMFIVVSTTSSNYTINNVNPETCLSGLVDEFTNGVFRLFKANNEFILDLVRFSVTEA